MRFIICGNAETLTEGIENEGIDCMEADAAAAAVDAAVIQLKNQFGHDETETPVYSGFPDWHGGRVDQFYNRCGFVAVPLGVNQGFIDAAYAASETMRDVLEKY
jgi:hypothetical protein